MEEISRHKKIKKTKKEGKKDSTKRSSFFKRKSKTKEDRPAEGTSDLKEEGEAKSESTPNSVVPSETVDNLRECAKTIKESRLAVAKPDKLEMDSHDMLKPYNDWDKIKSYVRMNNTFKATFEKVGELKSLPKSGPCKGGTKSGNAWDTLMSSYIEKRDQSDEDAEIAKGLEGTLDTIFPSGFYLLESQFDLYGYMHDDIESRVYFWQGRADAIAWYQDHYVIVDWKVVDLLEFWEKNPKAYGAYLHQCLIYARLLKLHLQLDYLPYIMIVAIDRTTGKEVNPGLFKKYPEAVTNVLDAFVWSLEKPKVSVKIKSNNKKLLKSGQESGTIPPGKKLTEVFKSSATVKDLMEIFESRSLMIVD